MYLPPDKNAIASNDFDGNNNNNNGPVPNAYRTKHGPWTENGDYDLSTRTTNGLNSVQTAGPYGTSASGRNDYNGGRITTPGNGDCGGSTGAFSGGDGGDTMSGRKPTADSGYSGSAPNLDGRNRQGNGASQTDGTSPPDDHSSSSLRASDNYGRSASRQPGNNHGQTSANNGYDGFGHGQPPPEPGPPQTSDGHGRVESQIPSSGRGDYGQSSPSANGGYGRAGGGGPYGQSDSSTERNGHTRADTGYGDFGSAATGNWPASSGHGQGGTCCPPGGEDTVQGGLSSTGSPADHGHGIRNQNNKHSTLVPKDQYQNSNLPNGGFERQAKGSYGLTTNANGGEPGFNAFSNFAPGNRPNQPQPFGPSNNNCDRSSNHVNDASKLTKAVFPFSNAGY